MKNVLIIHNPHSGNKKNTYKILEDSKELFKEYGYNYNYVATNYKGHAREIVKSLENIDLVISVGGDGTFNEIVNGNIERKDKIVLSHIPVGTANDLRSLFCLGKDIKENIKLLLEGEDRQIDICLINDRPFVYVAGFGKFVSLSYETPKRQKSKYGYLAYVTGFVKDMFKKIHMYDIEYEIDGNKYSGRYSLGIISNANRIAGINNFYKDVKLDDDKFEVVFCSISKRIKLLKSLVDLEIYDASKVNGIVMHRTDNLKIKFKNNLKKNFTIDGEKYPKKEEQYDIKIYDKLKFRITKKAIEKNCIK